MAEFEAGYGQGPDETPLDPAAERLRRKLVRLLLVSGAIMVLGFIAVFAAIVHKLGGRGVADPSPAALGSEFAIAVPPGARLVASDLDGDRALLTIQAADGATALLLVDLFSGAVVGRYAVNPAADLP